MLTIKLKLIIMLVGFFSFNFPKVYGMKNYQQQQTNIDVDEACIIQINEENKLLSNKEKAAKYKGMVYKNESTFMCLYRYPRNTPRKSLCKHKDFGTCIYNAQQLAKDNANVPSDIAQVRKDYGVDVAEVNCINAENKYLSNEEKASKYKSIYTHSNKSRSFTFECKYYDQLQRKLIWVCSRKDIGSCVCVARHKAKHDKTIPADVAQLNVEKSDIMNMDKVNRINKQIKLLKNIDTINTKTTTESHSESVDEENFVESEWSIEESKKRKRNENSEFYRPSEYITIAKKVIISPKYSIRAKVDTQKVPMGTSLYIVRFITNKIEGVIRGQLHDGRWITIKKLDSEVSCVMEKKLLDDLFKMLFD